MRCFLAIDLPQSVRDAFAHDFKIHKEKLDRQGLRWVRNEKLHLTLVFLGESDAEPASAPIQAIVSRFKSVMLKTAPMGCFPDWERPSVLWVGVEDESGSLAELQLELVVGLDGQEPAGDEPAEFTPHIIFARMKPASKPLGRHYRGYVKSLVHQDQTEYALPITWTASEITLFESMPDGSYRAIDTFRLGS